MRRYLFLFVGLFLYNISYSQVYNHGKIILQKDAKLEIADDFYNYEGGNVDNSGVISLEGDWENNAENNVFISNKGKVIFKGAGQAILKNHTAFGDVVISNGAIAILGTDADIDNLQFNEDGIFFLGGFNIKINDNSVNGIKSDKGGFFSFNHKSKVVWAAGDVGRYVIPFITLNIKTVPIIMELQEDGIRTLKCNTYATEVNNKPYPENIDNLILDGKNVSDRTIDRFWFIDPDNINTKVTFSFIDAEVTGNINKDYLELMYYDGSKWVLDTLGQYDGGDKNSYTSFIDKSTWYTLYCTKPNTVHDLNNTKNSILLSVYPNPAKDELFIKLPKENNDYKMELRDVSGLIIRKQQLLNISGTLKLKLSDLNPGMYYISFLQKNNKKYYAKFVVVK